jgi:saccharopine dehydrogenase (NAD+, L-lysine-forming)
VKPYKTVDDLVAYLSERVKKAVAKTGGTLPSVMVMGALGRCGSGAVDLSKRVGIPECGFTFARSMSKQSR